MNLSTKESHLGKTSNYEGEYNPSLLFPVLRKEKREEIGIYSESDLPFYGSDIWNHYEVSWLNEKGKPVVAVAKIEYSCNSSKIVESKSLKLYFNSLNQSKFKDVRTLENIIKKDLEIRLDTSVNVKITPLAELENNLIYKAFEGISIDELDVECTRYMVYPEYLKTENTHVENEILTSDLLKSNCLVTNQPDWGSVVIQYSGHKINREGLLQYIVSFRNHNEFHEQCIERIFMDISARCRPEKLTVYGRYTRRGGIDINPFRTTDKNFKIDDLRLVRQ